MSETTNRNVASMPSVGNAASVISCSSRAGLGRRYTRSRWWRIASMTSEGASSSPRRSRRKVAFVLGGGGQMGAHEVGMIRALLERDIRPDLVVGTSVGALNGAAVAASPDVE